MTRELERWMRVVKLVGMVEVSLVTALVVIAVYGFATATTLCPYLNLVSCQSVLQTS